jgi:hypothetical protein
MISNITRSKPQLVPAMPMRTIEGSAAESGPSPTCSSTTKPLLLGAPPTLGYRSPIEFKKLVSTEPATVQHLCAWGRSDRLDVLGPALKSLSHLRFIFRAIVDPCDASTVTAHVI